MSNKKSIEASRRHYLIVNSLTFVRGAAALGTGLLALTGNPGLALGIQLPVHAMTEIDGTLARKWHVTSKKGAFRDYVADGASFSAGLLAAYKIMESNILKTYTPSQFELLATGILILSGMTIIDLASIYTALVQSRKTKETSV